MMIAARSSLAKVSATALAVGNDPSPPTKTAIIGEFLVAGRFVNAVAFFAEPVARLGSVGAGRSDRADPLSECPFVVGDKADVDLTDVGFRSVPRSFPNAVSGTKPSFGLVPGPSGRPPEASSGSCCPVIDIGRFGLKRTESLSLTTGSLSASGGRLFGGPYRSTPRGPTIRQCHRHSDDPPGRGGGGRTAIDPSTRKMTLFVATVATRRLISDGRPFYRFGGPSSKLA